MLEPNGWCYNCGRDLQPIYPGEVKLVSLFCDNQGKCKRQYEKKQDKGNLRGKRAGYGIKGSTH